MGKSIYKKTLIRIHPCYTVQGDIFHFIVKACRTFNVQVFITTHSIEAIDSLLATQDYDIQSKEDAITVVTLRRENHKRSDCSKECRIWLQ